MRPEHIHPRTAGYILNGADLGVNLIRKRKLLTEGENFWVSSERRKADSEGCLGKAAEEQPGELV